MRWRPTKFGAVFFLLAGISLNFAATWTLAMSEKAFAIHLEYIQPQDSRWKSSWQPIANVRPPDLDTDVKLWTRFGQANIDYTNVHHFKNTTEHYWVFTKRVGMPFQSLEYIWITELTLDIHTSQQYETRKTFGYLDISGILSTLGLDSLLLGRLPYRIRPWEFASNTALITTTAWLVSCVWRRFKTDHRSRSSRCLDCGYQIEGLQTCPECGLVPDSHGSERTMPERKALNQ